MKEVLILIPAHNEAGRIEKLLEEFFRLELAEKMDVLVVNDHSEDRTAAAAADFPVQVVNLIYNMGYGSALQTGYKYAAKHGYRYVIQLDADGQHDVKNVERLYQALRGETEASGKSGPEPDVVIGSRFLSGAESFPVSRLKRMAIGMFSAMIRLATRQVITDPTSGLQGLSRRVVEFYAGYNRFDPGYADINMIMQMFYEGYRIVEIPAIMHPRESGTSMHDGWKPIWYMINMMLSTLTVMLKYRVFNRDIAKHHQSWKEKEERDDHTA